jgi:YHS domain-containing protein
MTFDIRPRLLWGIVLCAVLGTTLRAVAADPPVDGVWKFPPADEQVRGEFNNEDPVGLAAGQHLKTDCSINWTADYGKVYCFTTRTSMQFFQDSPQTYLSAAEKFFGQAQAPAKQPPQ